MPVSIRELAALTNTSPTAVSLILNERPHRYSKATVAKVREAAERYDYVPSIYAQTMRTKRFNNIYLIMGSGRSQAAMQPVMVRHLHDALASHGIRMGIALLDDAEFEESDFLSRLRRQWQCDGFCFAYNVPGPSSLRDQLADKQIPAVWYNQFQDFDTVHPDNYQAGYDLAGRLIEAGHTSIGYVCREQTDQYNHFSVDQRLEGITDALTNARLPEPKVFRLSEIYPPRQAEELKDILQRDALPTAWIFYADNTAKVFAMLVLRNGQSIPEDYSIATFGNAAEAWSSGIRISYMIEYFDRAGEALGHMLAGKIDGDPPAPKVVVPMVLREGDTIGPPRS